MGASRRHATAVVLAASALAIVACDAILDLGQYKNVACSEGDCDAGYESSAVSPMDSPVEAEAGTVVESGADAAGATPTPRGA